ncbi:MAG: SurA N-terminal domain-containing protein [Desulfobacterales bacterium]|jgi:peptidyl-prolyl cis-trans isomerase SurA
MRHSFVKISKFLSIYFLWGFIFNIGVFPFRVLAADAVVVDRIVAVVNEDLITLYDLNKTFEPYEENIKALEYAPEKERETLFKLRTDLLNRLIDRKLTDQIIKKNNIEVSEKEIDTALERLKEARSLTDEDLRAGLSRQGITLEEYRKNIKQQLLRTKLVNREIKSKIVITEKDIKNYYDAHREKYAGETKYHIWNIFIKLPKFADESAKSTAFEKMESVITKLKQGRTFESLAADDSDSPMAPKGADLGLYRLNELSSQLRKVVVDMKAGDFSPIIETDFGYQIIYVQKIVKTDAKLLAEVKSEIQEILYNEAVDNRFKAWLEELRKGAHIKIIK